VRRSRKIKDLTLLVYIACFPQRWKLFANECLIQLSIVNSQGFIHYV
jgi:hypothetical protein